VLGADFDVDVALILRNTVDLSPIDQLILNLGYRLVRHNIIFVTSACGAR
jgi:hypothetical protein